MSSCSCPHCQNRQQKVFRAGNGTEIFRSESFFAKAKAAPRQTWQFVLDMEHLAINRILQTGSSLSLKKAFARKCSVQLFHGALSGEGARHGH